MDEKEIIERVKKGNKMELEKLYLLYRNEFISWVRTNYNIEMQDAKDIYQQSVVLLYENIVSGKFIMMNSKVKSYLFGIGKNLVYEQNRRAARYLGLPESLSMETNDESPEEEIELNEQRELNLKLVKEALAKLGNPCKSLLELYYYHQKSMDEISDTLNYKNSATTKNLKYKCMLRLRKIFQAARVNQKSIVYE